MNKKLLVKISGFQFLKSIFANRATLYEQFILNNNIFQSVIFLISRYCLCCVYLRTEGVIETISEKIHFLQFWLVLIYWLIRFLFFPQYKYHALEKVKYTPNLFLITGCIIELLCLFKVSFDTLFSVTLHMIT